MITTEAEYKKALVLFAALMDDITEYEKIHYPIQEPSEADKAEFRKDQERA